MPIFILALVALVFSFAQDGKPPSTPPNTSEQVSNRGNEVSVVASDLDHQTANTGNLEIGGAQSESNQPEVSRVAADNTAASIELPKPIPQVAVDNSSVLEGSSGLLTSPFDQNSTLGQSASHLAQESSVPVSGPVVGSAIVGVLNQDLRDLPVAEFPEQGQVAVERTQGILP